VDVGDRPGHDPLGAALCRAYPFGSFEPIPGGVLAVANGAGSLAQRLGGSAAPPLLDHRWVQILAGVACLLWGLEWQFAVAGGIGALAMLLLIRLH